MLYGVGAWFAVDGCSGSIPKLDRADWGIIETTFNNPVGCNTYAEHADVSVSLDGSMFWCLGTVCKTENRVDIFNADVDLDWVRYVRVANNDLQSTSPDAFDVDGVIALHNWAEEAPFNLDAYQETPNYKEELAFDVFPNPTNDQSNVNFRSTFPSLQL